MAVVAVYDACVLYPSPLRDLLVRLAVEDLVVARWSDAILDEVFRNLSADRPDLDPGRLAVTRQRMNQAVLGDRSTTPGSFPLDDFAAPGGPYIGDRAPA